MTPDETMTLEQAVRMLIARWTNEAVEHRKHETMAAHQHFYGDAQYSKNVATTLEMVTNELSDALKRASNPPSPPERRRPWVGANVQYGTRDGWLAAIVTHVNPVAIEPMTLMVIPPRGGTYAVDIDPRSIDWRWPVEG